MSKVIPLPRKKRMRFGKTLDGTPVVEMDGRKLLQGELRHTRYTYADKKEGTVGMAMLLEMGHPAQPHGFYTMYYNADALGDLIDELTEAWNHMTDFEAQNDKT